MGNGDDFVLVTAFDDEVLGSLCNQIYEAFTGGVELRQHRRRGLQSGHPEEQAIVCKRGELGQG